MFKAFSPANAKAEPSSPPQARPADGQPRHVAIIMDGNGRWARKRRLPRAAGHKQGAETLRKLLETCPKLGVEHLTVYAFSAENWGRPEAEISDIMQLMKFYLKRELPALKENNIRLRVIGERERLPADLKREIEAAEAATVTNTRFNFTVCFGYGARQEIVRATRHLAADVAAGRLQADAITDEMFEACLYTSQLPELDLLIRTGGEKRMSNFLLWQSAYTELYFTDILWPDFSREHFAEATKDFTTRERRYGLTEPL